MKNHFLSFFFLFLLLASSCKKSTPANPPPGGGGAKELPANAVDGTTFTNGGKTVIFNLTAPGKNSVHLIGDFNDWKAEESSLMSPTPDGNRWWIQIDGIDPAKEYRYQYLVDGQLRIADPYAEKVLDPEHDSFISQSTYPGSKAYPTGKTTGIVSAFQSTATPFSWQSTDFKRPEKKDLVIYELLLRDFLEKHDYKTLTDSLDYLQRLGINAVELMPVNEFEGNLSWGYNPSFYFSPDKYYGDKNMLKRFIDECHSRGIAVILDLVLNHSFGQSPMVQLYFDKQKNAPSADNPWFNSTPTHPYNVGYDFNHESEYTRYFSKAVIRHWMEEYRIDGFRFDLSKGFTQKNSGTSEGAVGAWSSFDASRVAIWKDYNGFIQSIDPDGFYVILEHFADQQEQRALAAEGMMLWNNMNYAFNEATMGWVGNSDLSGAFYDRHGLPSADNLISYMESHDEERMMFKNLAYGNESGNYRVQDPATALKRQEMAAAFLMSIPGPKMIWQFGELGYDVSIEQNGRTGNKPIRWDYLKEGPRKMLYDAFARYIGMKTRNPIFKTADFDYQLAGPVKQIWLRDGGQHTFVIGNFDVVPQEASLSFPLGGTWYDYVDKTRASRPAGAYPLILQPGEYHIFSNQELR
jgi:1,4-alpha-glucan branching enzyme